MGNALESASASGYQTASKAVDCLVVALQRHAGAVNPQLELLQSK